jgi:hypothetical protein
MVVSENKQLAALKGIFLERCFDIVEKGVEDGDFRMKDVADCLGISSQVASKLANPTSPRVLTAFELFRMSILIRRPVTDIIPINYYLTGNELKDEDLCRALNATTVDTFETRILVESYMQLPENCRQCIHTLIRTMKEVTST